MIHGLKLKIKREKNMLFPRLWLLRLWKNKIIKIRSLKKKKRKNAK